jgi:beta-glucosidase-like glycosyl hydrolase
MWNTIGKTIATEARAFNNAGHAGLTFWTPNINIFRDPRWGRGQETPGEDPFLNAEYAANFVTGMQVGEDPNYVKASACCKHYAAYSLEDWGGVDRHHFDGNVTDQDWADTYLPAFQSCIQRGRGSIMCSYNANNGVPSCADHHLLTDDLRTSWGFNMYVTGDCGAVDDVQYTHDYTSNVADTCAAVLKAGLNVDCGGFLQAHLQEALNAKTVTEDDLNLRLTDLFSVQMRLGMFDPAASQPYKQIQPSAINTPTNQALALRAAQEGLVLLKNNGVLPLSKTNVKTIAVSGPNADAPSTLQGNYYGNAPYLITPRAGLATYATVNYTQGCSMSGTSTSGIDAAVTAAKNADATVIVVGLDQSQEAEGHDRTSIAFPGVQSSLLSQVSAGARGPVIVVLMSGSSVDISALVSSPDVDAILWVGYPGQSGGTAIAQVIFGDVNPSGRLPFTMHTATFINEVSMLDMHMRPGTNNSGRTYRFYTGKPIYTFGTGLSYTTFSYVVSDATPKVSARVVESVLKYARHDINKLREPEKILATVTVNVTNTGNVAGSDAVLYFIVPANAGQNGNPLKYLAGFQRVTLNPGQSTTVTFNVAAHDLSLPGIDGVYRTRIAPWTVQIGVGEQMIEQVIQVVGETEIDSN